MGEDPPKYAVNVDVAVRREPPETGPEYLFIVRGEDEVHAPGTLSFPGGTLEADPGEAGVVTGTARRELREEVGVELTDSEIVTSTTFELDSDHPCLNLVVTAEYDGGEAHVADPEEVGAVEWRTAEDVLGADETPPWTRDLLEAVLDHRQG